MTCARCGVNPGSRPVAAQDWCEPCWLTFRDDVTRRVITETPSTLVQRGVLRPDHGAGMAEVECLSCAATLVAVPLDPCPYCEVAWERMVQWQAEKLLRPQLPDPDDVRFLASAQAWLDRMAVGVSAGIITEAQARSAWERNVIRVAA